MVKKQDEKQVNFWMPNWLHKKMLKKQESLRKQGEPYTTRAFINSLIKNAVE